jgi:hypothetical protein
VLYKQGVAGSIPAASRAFDFQISIELMGVARVSRKIGIISELPAIRPESMPSAEITSYKPTSQDQSARWNPDTFRLADHPPGRCPVRTVLSRRWFSV